MKPEQIMCLDTFPYRIGKNCSQRKQYVHIMCSIGTPSGMTASLRTAKAKSIKCSYLRSRQTESKNVHDGMAVYFYFVLKTLIRIKALRCLLKKSFLKY